MPVGSPGQGLSLYLLLLNLYSLAETCEWARLSWLSEPFFLSYAHTLLHGLQEKKVILKMSTLATNPVFKKSPAAIFWVKGDGE